MPDFTIQINGIERTVSSDEDKPLLWILRDDLNLTGTKYGCGIGQCGACTVHVDEQPVRSCSFPISAIGSQKITTIEGLTEDKNNLLIKSWEEENVPQCGYCQAGQVMSAAALIAANQNPTDEDIAKAMSGNICRCGTYTRIRTAIKKAAAASR